MKGEKQHRRKSKNHQITLMNDKVHQRVVGFPYEQILPRARAQKIQIIHKGGNNNVIAVKTIATSDQLKARRLKDPSAAAAVSTKIDIGDETGAKKYDGRAPRFGSESGGDNADKSGISSIKNNNNNKESRYLVPTLWHKAEDNKKKGKSSHVSSTIKTANTGKKARMFDDVIARKDSKTPHLVRLEESGKFNDMVGLAAESSQNSENTKIMMLGILAQSGDQQQQLQQLQKSQKPSQKQDQKRFKRQRSNSSLEGRSSSKQPSKQFQANADPYADEIIAQSSKTGGAKQTKLRQLQSNNIHNKETAETNYMLQKPTDLNQSTKLGDDVQGSEILQLLTNTTIHLKAEAERIQKGGTGSKQTKITATTGFSKKSRESQKLIQETKMNTHRSQKEQVASLNLNEVDFDGNTKINLKEPLTSSKMNKRATAAHDRHYEEDLRSPSSIQFKSKYPQTRLKTDQPLQKSAQRKSQLDNKKDLVNQGLPENEQQQPSSNINNHRKVVQKVSAKRKPANSTTVEDDYERLLFLEPKSSAGGETQTTSNNSKPKRIKHNITNPTTKQVVVATNISSKNGAAHHPQHLQIGSNKVTTFQSVAMSLGSIKVERSQRNQNNNQSSDYVSKKQRGIEQVDRVMMPQIAQTPNLSMSQKQSQSTISRLSSKQKQNSSNQPHQSNRQQNTGKISSQSEMQSRKQNQQQQKQPNNNLAQLEHNKSLLVINSPPNSHAQERRPLFDQGRSSRTKKGSTFYPALAHGGVSTAKLPEASLTVQVESMKVQMPHLQANPSSSIQTSNNNKSKSTNDTATNLLANMAKESTGANTNSKDYSGVPGTVVALVPQVVPVYTKTAPKFIEKGSIKMQQVKAAASQSIATTASIKNLHEYGVGTKRPTSMVVAGATNSNNTINIVGQYKRPFMPGQRGIVVGQTGRPIQYVNRPRHALATSSSSSQVDSADESPQNQSAKHQQNEEECAVEQQSPDINSQKRKDEDASGSNVLETNRPKIEEESISNNEQKVAVDGELGLVGLPPIIPGQEANSKSAENSTVEKKVKKRKARVYKLLFNLMYTQYPLVKSVAKELNFRTKTNDVFLLPSQHGTEEYYMRQSGVQHIQAPDFDVSWIDGGVMADALTKLKPYQRISQFPGISAICNKKKLGNGLMRMYKRKPEEYDFFPQTYMLPTEYNEFKLQFEKKNNSVNNVGSSSKKQLGVELNETYIVKPENLCQGKGIYLVKDPSEVDHTEHCVAQKYIKNPFLIDDMKFDMRLYVLLYGVNPLRIFLFKEGIVRLATEPYVTPTEQNIDNLFMHLTNYAINKKNDNFQQNVAEDSDGDYRDDGTHKRSLTSLYYTLLCMDKNVNKLKAEINDLLIKTLITAQPNLSHLYKSSQPDDLENQLCFQVLGFDVLIDENCKPWLIEVNQSPSFKADSGLDKRVKEKLINDTINLLNLSVKRKQKYLNQMKLKRETRMFTGKKAKLTPEERQEKLKDIEDERDEFEKAKWNRGKFRMIYPCEDKDKMASYDELQKISQENWEIVTYGKNRRQLTKPKLDNTATAAAAAAFNNNAKSSSTNDMGVQDDQETNVKQQQQIAIPKPTPDQIKNYMPAWERKFQKSLQQKQARMNIMQQQSSADNRTLTARQIQDPPSARGQSNSVLIRQSQNAKGSKNKGVMGEKSTVLVQDTQGGKESQSGTQNEVAATTDDAQVKQFDIEAKELSVSIERIQN